MPGTNIYLGNVGNASRSLLFTPSLKAGWDPGFHSFDVYKWQMDKARFFNTTRAYSELAYLLGSRSEQIIELLNTQNIKPNWNAAFQYRMINSPGFFQSQKTSDNNYLFTSWYQSVNKRYNNYFVLLGNKLMSSENGGMKSDENYLNDPLYTTRYNIPTNIGQSDFSRDFFSTSIFTGNTYKEFTVLMRQQFDLGKKDSLVLDTTVVPLFYPRLRFEHSFSYSSYKYQYADEPHANVSGGYYYPDSTWYRNTYGISFSPGDTVKYRDQWKEMLNDFSVYQFPDKNNLQQFIKLGASLQNLKGTFLNGSKAYYNIIGHGEYRNRTRNQKWDMEALGKLYFAGTNAGDYEALVSLQRYAGKKLGYVQLGFENVNSKPSFLFNSNSSFYLDTANTANFKKQNVTHLFASFNNPAAKLRLSGHYYLMTNYTYFTDYYKLQQDGTVYNLLRISLEKTLKLGKHWNWYAEVYLQQKTGTAPVNIPLIYTRNRVAYEGLFFKNLNLSTGVELRYFTPYKADGYSPLLGQFYYQDSVTIKEHLPDVSLFLHFRIRSFKLYFRVENLNTASGLGFTNNNLVAPGYAMPGLQMRMGIYWNFVN